MRRKPLIETNRYLRVSVEYRKGLITNVSSSTAIETGKTVKAIAKTLLESKALLDSETQKRLLDNL